MIGGVLGVAYVGSNSSLASPVGHLPLCLRHRKLLKLHSRILEFFPFFTAGVIWIGIET